MVASGIYEAGNLLTENTNHYITGLTITTYILGAATKYIANRKMVRNSSLENKSLD